jgi:hypothetical protein
MKTTYVIYHEEIGIYLGECLGLMFWSKLDSVGQEAAPTWPTEEEALEFVKQYRDNLRNPDLYPLEAFKIVGVQATEVPEQYASIEDCVRVGLPSWDPDEY